MKKIMGFISALVMSVCVCSAQLIMTPKEVSGTHVWTYSSNLAAGTASLVITNAPGEPCILGSVGLCVNSGTNALTVSRIRTDKTYQYVGDVVDTNSPALHSVETNHSWSVTNVVTVVTTNTLLSLTTTNATSIVVSDKGVSLDGQFSTSAAMARLFLRDYDVIEVDVTRTNYPVHVDVTAIRY